MPISGNPEIGGRSECRLLGRAFMSLLSNQVVWLASGNARYGILIRVSGSVRLDACELHHLCPFLGFLGDELAELDRRHWHSFASQIGKARFHLGIGETGIDFLVEPGDDVDRRAPGCTKTGSPLARGRTGESHRTRAPGERTGRAATPRSRRWP